MKVILAIALGGALGAVGRHLVAGALSRALPPGFPWGTLAVNLIGSALMGLLVGLLAHRLDISTEMRVFLMVGLLGGFTTFSTFSMETVLLIERGQLALAGGYMIASVGLSVLGFLACLTLTRGFA